MKLLIHLVPAKLKALYLVLFIVFGLIAQSLFVSVLPGSTLFGHRDAVDINTGRTRMTFFVLGKAKSEKIQDTILTRVLPESERAGLQPDWRTYRGEVRNWYPPFKIKANSPLYAYRDCGRQMNRLAGIFKMAQMDETAQHECARTILRLWQADGGTGGGEDYLNRLEAIVRNQKERVGTPKAVLIADLPTSRPLAHAEKP